MSRFLITGLPRSRTAWFAVVTGARHEPISHGQFLPWPEDTGISDSGAAWYVEQLIGAEWPSRTLIIERPKDDVIRSLTAYVGGHAKLDWNKVDALLDEALLGLRYQHPSIKRVAFRELEDIGVVRQCLAHLQIGEPVNLPQLMHMVIESSLAWNLAALLLRFKAS